MPAAFPKPQIVAHRGYHAAFVENSLAAFRAAGEAGADWIECDVQASADGEPVIMHDETLDRTTTASGPVSGLTASMLAQTPLRGLGSVPLLRDISPTTKMIVEIKPPDAADLVRRVLTLRAGGPWMIQSFDEANVLHAQACDANTPVALLVDYPEILERAIAKGWKNIHLHHDLLTESTALAMRSRGISIGVWTVNTAREMHRVIQLGASMIITDELPLALSVIAML